MAFKEATRAGTKALIGLYGGSGAGKTFSALLMARGLAGVDGVVMMLDTENRRGEIYADEIAGGYEVEQVTEPYSPKKFSTLIAEAEAHAGEREACLVVDSFSHEWEGIGGVISMAETIAEAKAKKWGEWNGTVAFGDWKTPKQEHKRMMLKMLGSKMHIICCLRAQYASHQVEQKDFAKYGITAKTKTAVIRDNFQTPIQDKNFIFEMMAHVELDNQNPGAPILRKCPSMLLPAFQATPQISIETGKLIAAWTAGGAPSEEKHAEAMEIGEKAASCGMDAYKRWFGEQSNDIKTYLTTKGLHETFKRDAEDADRVAQAEGNDNGS